MDLFEASEYENIDRIRQLLDSGVNPNISIGGDTPLMVASDYGHTSIVKILLENGADPNLLGSAGYDKSALSNACNWGNIDIVRLLLKYGADPNIILTYDSVREGRVALMFAYDYNDDGGSSDASWDERLKIVRLLLDHGADVNYKNGIGETPLTIATEYAPLEIIKLLLERGAVSIDEALLVANSPPKRRLLIHYRNLQFSKQCLALTSSMHPRLGYGSSLRNLDYDTIQELMNYITYNPDITRKMRQEKERDRYTQARQRSALSKLQGRIYEMTGRDLDPSIFGNISEHLSRMKPVHSIQERMLLQDRQRDADEAYLRTLGPQDREQFLRERESRLELEPEHGPQTGRGKRSRKKRKTKKKRGKKR